MSSVPGLPTLKAYLGFDKSQEGSLHCSSPSVAIFQGMFVTEKFVGTVEKPSEECLNPHHRMRTELFHSSVNPRPLS